MIETFAALAGRNYRFYWIGLVFYVLGHRAEYVTFAWLTWEVTHDPMALGYLGLAQGVPLVLFQLYGGVLADRIDRLKLLLVTQILTALALTAAFILAVLGQVRLPNYYYTSADVLLIDMVMKAGGPAPTADVNNMVIRRGGEVIWNAQDTRTALADGLSLDRLHLRAGDELYVDDLKSGLKWQTVMSIVGPVIGLLGYLRYVTR